MSNGAPTASQRVLRLLRKGVGLPGLRRLSTITPVIRVTGAIRGALVAETRRFALNELRPSDSEATYTLRRGARRVVIRHHSSDVGTLHDIFAGGEYEPPAPVAARLTAAGAAPRVVDLGANIGLFGLWMLARAPAAQIVAYEPDPENAAVHERVIALNEAAAQWRLIPACAATADGRVRFVAGEGAGSHADLYSAESERAMEVPAADVFPTLMNADFAKIDIEGGEWALLDDPRFADIPTPALCLEYHPYGCTKPDPAIAARDRLSAAGYQVELVANAHLPELGLAWAWKP